MGEIGEGQRIEARRWLVRHLRCEERGGEAGRRFNVGKGVANVGMGLEGCPVMEPVEIGSAD